MREITSRVIISSLLSGEPKLGKPPKTTLLSFAVIGVLASWDCRGLHVSNTPISLAIRTASTMSALMLGSAILPPSRVPEWNPRTPYVVCTYSSFVSDRFPPRFQTYLSVPYITLFHLFTSVHLLISHLSPVPPIFPSVCLCYPVTRSQLQPRSDLGLVSKPTGSTSRPPHAPSTPSRSTAINALPSHMAHPPSHPPHSRHPFACPRRRFLFPSPSVRGSLAHSSRTPPSLCLDIVPYSSRCLATTPDVRYLPFYLSPLLLLGSPNLPEPQAHLATPHHFLDSAYTLFPPRVPITRFVSLAYSPFFPSSPTTPFSIWTLPAHRDIFPVHFLLLRYAS